MSPKTELANWLEKYKTWVSANPQLVGDYENIIKWASYFLAGRIDSNIVSELFYTLSSMITFYNDRIIEAKNFEPSYTLGKSSERKIRIMLNILDYCEVFIELSALKQFGNRGKWFFIYLVQIVKCIGRLVLVVKYRSKITVNPAIAVLNRSNCSKPDNMIKFEAEDDLVLKSSNKVVRKINGAPPVMMRNWKPLPPKQNINSVHGETEGKLIKNAEILYILKPVIHLSSITAFGYNSWKSWGMTSLIDFSSLLLYYQERHLLTATQKSEISRRHLSMLLYLLRSPFYDKYSKERILNLLEAISSNIPLSKLICRYVLDYLPYWQSVYFYVWSS